VPFSINLPTIGPCPKSLSKLGRRDWRVMEISGEADAENYQCHLEFFNLREVKRTPIRRISTLELVVRMSVNENLY
jgi:hypothetical protein